jgi:hypothetical protein
MKGEACPICEERSRLALEGDEEGAQELKVSKHRLVWIVDRKNPEDGPAVWKMPVKSVYAEICDRCDDPDTGEVLKIDHADDGYDVQFRRAGKTKNNTSYSSVEICRNSSSVSDDDEEYNRILDAIEDQPLPSLLNYYDYDYIATVFSGRSPSASIPAEEPDDDSPPPKSRRQRRTVAEVEPEDDSPPPKSRRGRKVETKSDAAELQAAAAESVLEDIDDPGEEPEADEPHKDLKDEVSSGLKRRRRQRA